MRAWLDKPRARAIDVRKELAGGGGLYDWSPLGDQGMSELIAMVPETMGVLEAAGRVSRYEETAPSRCSKRGQWVPPLLALQEAFERPTVPKETAEIRGEKVLPHAKCAADDAAGAAEKKKRLAAPPAPGRTPPRRRSAS